jgi:raffinose/stachyose/melibiose transport system permease protein
MKSSIRSMRKVELFQSYGMIFPSLIGLGLFVIYPLIWVFRYCLYSSTGIGTMYYVGFANFVQFFTKSGRYWQAVGNTFVFAIGKLIVELSIALVCAALLSGKMRFRSFFRSVYFMPSMLSVAVMGIIFYFLFGSYNGVVNEMIRVFGGKRISWFTDPVLSMVVLMITSIWQNFGLNMLFFMTGFMSISPELYEAASIDGARRSQQFFMISIPMLGPVLQMIVMNALLGSLKVTDLVLVMTGGAPDGATEVMMSYVYKQFFGYGAKNYGYGAVLIIMTALILGVVTVIYLKTTKKNIEIY